MSLSEKLTVRDIVTAACMMVLFYIMSFALGMSMVPFPVIYLYLTCGVEMFIGAVFFLVAAHRINKNGLLFMWCAVYGVITAVMGYVFMLPYFLVLGVLAELSMIGKNAYRSPKRNSIGWSIYGAGMILGNGVPIWYAWDKYKELANSSGYTDHSMKLTIDMVTTPHLLAIAVGITVVMAILGIQFGYKILNRHFKKAGVI